MAEVETRLVKKDRKSAQVSSRGSKANVKARMKPVLVTEKWRQLNLQYVRTEMCWGQRLAVTSIRFSQTLVAL